MNTVFWNTHNYKPSFAHPCMDVIYLQSFWKGVVFNGSVS